jgi:hypothetical protein
MALDVASLTLDDSQASLASMPEELWRKIGSYLRPATTARAFVVASRSSSLQKALRAEIEQTERALFGMTRRDAYRVLVTVDEDYAGCSRSFASYKLGYVLETSCRWSEHEETELRWGRAPCDISTHYVVVALLAYGADPNAMFDEVPVLVLVARLVASRRPTTREDTLAVTEFLLRAGANPTLTESNGMSALATCYRNLQTWYEQRDWESAVAKLELTKDLIVQLVVGTIKHMRPAGSGQAELDAVYDLFKTQEAALGTTFFDVTARYLRFLDHCGSDERFVRVLLAGGDTEDIDMEEVLMARVQKFASSIMTLHLSTRTFRFRHDEPPPAADEPEGRLEALARSFAADKPEGGLEALARLFM